MKPSEPAFSRPDFCYGCSEGAFLACTFWLADNYAFAGRITEAEELFERLLTFRNHLALLSEEYDPKLRRQISNFAQAFSHLALILTRATSRRFRQYYGFRI